MRAVFLCIAASACLGAVMKVPLTHQPKTKAQFLAMKQWRAEAAARFNAQAGGEQTKALTDEFPDSYAILGGAATCIERLGVLARLGIDKCVVSGPNLAARGPGEDAATSFIEDVAPALRA